MTIPDRYLHTPRSISPEASAREAAEAMKKHQVGCLVVVDERNRPVGVVTDRDLALNVLRSQVRPDDFAVADCMSAPAVTLSVEESVLDAARAMRRELIRRLPIVNDAGSVVGIVTADDLAGDFADDVHWLAEAAPQGLANEAMPQATGGSIFGKE